MLTSPTRPTPTAQPPRRAAGPSFSAADYARYQTVPLPAAAAAGRPPRSAVAELVDDEPEDDLADLLPPPDEEPDPPTGTEHA